MCNAAVLFSQWSFILWNIALLAICIETFAISSCVSLSLSRTHARAHIVGLRNPLYSVLMAIHIERVQWRRRRWRRPAAMIANSDHFPTCVRVLITGNSLELPALTLKPIDRSPLLSRKLSDPVITSTYTRRCFKTL